MKNLCWILVLFFATACNNDEKKDPDVKRGLSLLTGLWFVSDGEGGRYEEWSEMKGDSMTGKAYKLLDQDTLMSETITIKRDDTATWYIPVVRSQNQGLPVKFRLTGSADTAFTFENPQHDFPQRIIYRFVTKDSVVARIEGDVEGELQSIEFNLRRMQ